jgi:hypothetical protein
MRAEKYLDEDGDMVRDEDGQLTPHPSLAVSVRFQELMQKHLRTGKLLGTLDSRQVNSGGLQEEPYRVGRGGADPLMAASHRLNG